MGVDLVAHARAFVAVADEGGFTRAAGALAVPQPVVSRRVAGLERHLGHRLVERGPRAATLTEAGRRLLPHARELVARAERLLEAARADDEPVAVAVPPGADPRALAVVGRAARRAGAPFGVVEGSPAERAEAVRSGAAVAALVPAPPDEATLTAGLGAATARQIERPRRFHADALRRATGSTAPRRRLHLDVEDDVPWLRDVVERLVAEAALAPGQLVVGAPRTEALVGVHQHGDVWLCTRAEATAQGLGWRPVADADLSRGYRVAGRAEVLAPVLAELAAAVGAEPVTR